MAMFAKTTVHKRTNAYSDYKKETTRVDTDFTINALKNVHKNYKFKTENCAQSITIQPSSTDFQYLVIQPDGLECEPRVAETQQVCYNLLTVSPDSELQVCYPGRNIEQVPFVLASRGIIFRRRSTPYFTTMSNPEGYIG